VDAHAIAERRFDGLNSICAIISIGSLVSLGVVASGFNLAEGTIRYMVILVGVAVALVTVLATIRNYGVRAAAHRGAARQYAALRRDRDNLD